MTSNFLTLIKEDTGEHMNSQAVNLPRFNKQFIGIGHQLEEKKRQRRKIQQEQRAMANRVIYLQKQELRAQQNLKKKKAELTRTLQTIQRANHQKLQKQHMRRIKQLQLEALREENRNRRLSHKQAQQSARYSIETEKHNTYSRIKSFIKEKQQEKQDFLYEDIKQKKDKWLSLNIQKEKGKQKIDLFYKKKNAQHTLAYMQMIQREQATKMQKINTIKHLEEFESALRKKLEQSTSRISQLQDKIMKSSRTLDVSVQSGKSKTPKQFSQPKNKPKNYNNSNLASYTVEPYNPQLQNIQLNICFDREGEDSENGGCMTERVGCSSRKPNSQENQIEERIQYPNVEQVEMPAFKIIRTVKKRKKSTKNKYKEYQLL